MKKRLCGILIATQLMVVCLAAVNTNTQPTTKQQFWGVQVNSTPLSAANTGASTNPAILVSPGSLDFESVTVGRKRNLTFIVQNVGPGSVTGAAEVLAPFRIVGGSPYVLQSSQSQVITVQYVPRTAGVNVTIVRLTGKDSPSITVAGSAVPPPAAAPGRPLNLRLLAGR